ncbi:MAG: translation initiation factor IF-2 [Candidatus Azambacteria bacterium]|nr:translation initiation factor IF-2 [Candidatus Azambacteria bacterium]
MPNSKNNNLIPRPPVVVIMGHVDHGKTKLLDYIRKTNVAEKEAGGITQHIGAYEIIYKTRKITFLDTPGHEAFSKLRGRGAKAADIAILVVAADDGVKAQTIEAIEHIKKSELPFIVAINKTDKPEANPEKVKKELAENDVLVESWSGKVPSVEISAKQGKNINELLDLVLLLADLNELKANPKKPGEGLVIETNLDPRRGIVASLLILDGTIQTGDYISSGEVTGKIKMIEDFLGNSIAQASFSSPVIVIGFTEPPQVGEKFSTDKTPITTVLKIAKKIGELIEKSVYDEPGQITKPEEKIKNTVNVIIKSDFQSSAEAIKEGFEKMVFSPYGGSPEGRENTLIKILKAETGNVNSSNLELADLSNAIIIAFNVKVDSTLSLYEKLKGKIISGNIIYEILDKAKELIETSLKPRPEREEIGQLRILAVFRKEKNRQVVGGKVTSGEIVKNARIEIVRDDAVIGQGRIISVESEKKEVGKVEAGRETGIAVDFGEPKITVGDMVVLFRSLVKLK